VKNLIAILISVFSINLFAIDSNVFAERYPTFQTFNQILFADVRTYFEALPIHSLNYTDADGVRIYRVHYHGQTEFSVIFSKITRTQSDNEIIERVSYALENGNSIGYEIIKRGEGIIPSKDADLLSFNFKKGINDTFYQLTVPNYNFQLTYKKNGNDENTLFYMGLMEISVQIESHFQENKASLDYIYFYKGMPTPQASLTVQAIETTSQWSGLQYIHISSQAAGEITPGQFFAGLKDGAGIFFGGGKMMMQMLSNLGFQKLD
jgi:hypothetical protein